MEFGAGNDKALGNIPADIYYRFLLYTLTFFFPFANTQLIPILMFSHCFFYLDTVSSDFSTDGSIYY